MGKCAVQKKECFIEKIKENLCNYRLLLSYTSVMRANNLRTDENLRIRYSSDQPIGPTRDKQR